MKELRLKYGCNPNQGGARIFMDRGELPIEVLSGMPGYINLLDALNAWQLVSELHAALGMPAAASFKHVSPAGAAVGLPLSQIDKLAFRVEDVEGLNDSPQACAYARARGTDRLSSYGDFIALSDICDETTARLIKREVSDGVIAPAYTAEALDILREKRSGKYNVIRIDPSYKPEETEKRQVCGVWFEQRHNDAKIDASVLKDIVTKNKALTEIAQRDLVLALITLKYTQSNSVCCAYAGQTTGVGAGQQSRVHCTRLACNKHDLWVLRRSEKVLSLPFRAELKRPDKDNVTDVYLGADCRDVLEDWQRYFTKKPEALTEAERSEALRESAGAALGSDAFFPFDDSVIRAARSGITYIAQPGGSIRDADVIRACDSFGMVMVMGVPRLFHH